MLKPAVERHLARRAGEPGEFCEAHGNRSWLLSRCGPVSSLSRWTPRSRTDFTGRITVVPASDQNQEADTDRLHTLFIVLCYVQLTSQL